VLHLVGQLLIGISDARNHNHKLFTVSLLLLLLLLLYDMDISCHRPFLPGTFLEPAVIPTAQASSFTLQYPMFNLKKNVLAISSETAIPIDLCYFSKDGRYKLHSQRNENTKNGVVKRTFLSRQLQRISCHIFRFTWKILRSLVAESIHISYFQV